MVICSEYKAISHRCLITHYDHVITLHLIKEYMAGKSWAIQA